MLLIYVSLEKFNKKHKAILSFKCSQIVEIKHFKGLEKLNKQKNVVGHVRKKVKKKLEILLTTYGK